VTAVVETTGVLTSEARRDVRIPTVARRRRLANGAATWLLYLATAIAAGALLLVIIALLRKGASSLDAGFFTRRLPVFSNADASAIAKLPAALRAKYHIGSTTQLGVGPAIAGTLVSTAMASLLAIPLGVLGAIYLNEFGKQNLMARIVRFFADVMTGVPSIVMGLFVYTVWVVRYGTSGPSAFAAALALACLMLPIVIRASEEMLRLVPDELRSASTAIGARRWETTLRVVLPAALGGITSGAMLAVARAAGETAPVLFTIGVIGGNQPANWSLSGGNTTLAAQIFNNAKQGDPRQQQFAWAAAITLVLLVFLLTFVARLIANRFSTSR
jgi:phosphate transport system permease protein